MPCYTGTLSGYVGDQVVPYPSGESEGDEEVNPVSVWVVNDQLLVLLCASEDAPYVDLLHHEILREDPDCSLTRAEQRRYVRLPDYLEYTESEA